MTEEEMAERYIKSNNLASPIGEVKQAFLAGLRARKSEWHDLTKDSNDLPPADPMCPQFSVQVFSSALTPIYYCFETKEWMCARRGIIVHPCAWYHVPDYEWEK